MEQDYNPVKVDAPIVVEGQNCWQVGDYYITAQPTDSPGFGEMNKLGIKSVVCLRDASEKYNAPYLAFDPLEDLKVTEFGMAFVNIPFPHIPPPAPPLTQGQFDLRAAVVLDALNSLPKPLLMHCSSGDRASALWAVHLIDNCGLTKAQAIQYATISGLAVFKPYVENYQPAA